MELFREYACVGCTLAVMLRQVVNNIRVYYVNSLQSFVSAFFFCEELLYQYVVKSLYSNPNVS